MLVSAEGLVESSVGLVFRVLVARALEVLWQALVYGAAGVEANILPVSCEQTHAARVRIAY